MLQNYFRSGWAFLIPYLAAYLLYAWLRWPVNPATGLLHPPRNREKFDLALDGREELRFRNTHPMLHRYIKDHFRVAVGLATPRECKVLVPKVAETP
jgi:hypothetical protein